MCVRCCNGVCKFDMFCVPSHAVPFSLSLTRTKPWLFKALNFSEGQTIVGGSIFGEVYENELMKKHMIMLPPDLYGTVVRVYGTDTDGKDTFTLEDTVLEIEHGDTGEIIPIGMSHFWCVCLLTVQFYDCLCALLCL